MSVSGSHEQLREWHARGASGLQNEFDWGTFWLSLSWTPPSPGNPPDVRLLEQSEQGYVFDGLASDLVSMLPLLERRFPGLFLELESV